MALDTRGRGPFSLLTASQRSDLLHEACGLLTGLKQNEACLFTIVVDKKWWFLQNPGKTGDDLYIQMFEDLVTRFDYYLKRCHASGTRWASLENVIETVLILESHESPGVQLADLASYALWRLIEAADDGLAPDLKYCFDREPITSGHNPGKWHGVRYHGPASTEVRKRINGIWS